jgi:MFS family permease
VLLPVAGTLADALPRRSLAVWGCLVRGLAYAILGVFVGSDWLVPAQLYLVPLLPIVNAVGGALFDASSVAMVPELLQDREHERGVGYALVIPRIGFLFTGFVCFYLLRFIGAVTTAYLLAGLALVAAVLVRLLPAGTRAVSVMPGAKAWLRLLTMGPLFFLRSPRLLRIAVITALIGFSVSPFYTLAPLVGPGNDGLKRPEGFLKDVELYVALGVILGAWATQRLTRFATPSQVVGGSFIVLGVSLFLFTHTRVDYAVYGLCLVMGVSLHQIASLTGISAILSAADESRGRVVALLTAVYEAAGELGHYTLLPQIEAHGMQSVLGILAVALVLLIGPVLIVSRMSLGVVQTARTPK